MSHLVRARQRAGVLLTVTVGLAGVVGLGACSSSDASGDATVPRSIVTVTATEATAPAATHPPVTTSTVAPVADTVATAAPAPTTTSVAPTTAAPAQADSEALVLTHEEVADFERELDEIDQLLAGVDADLSQD
jgi:hypothetical protein